MAKQNKLIRTVLLNGASNQKYFTLLKGCNFKEGDHLKLISKKETIIQRVSLNNSNKQTYIYIPKSSKISVGDQVEIKKVRL